VPKAKLAPPSRPAPTTPRHQSNVKTPYPPPRSPQRTAPRVPSNPSTGRSKSPHYSTQTLPAPHHQNPTVPPPRNTISDGKTGEIDPIAEANAELKSYNKLLSHIKNSHNYNLKPLRKQDLLCPIAHGHPLRLEHLKCKFPNHKHFLL